MAGFGKDIEIDFKFGRPYYAIVPREEYELLWVNWSDGKRCIDGGVFVPLIKNVPAIYVGTLVVLKTETTTGPFTTITYYYSEWVRDERREQIHIFRESFPIFKGQIAARIAESDCEYYDFKNIPFPFGFVNP